MFPWQEGREGPEEEEEAGEPGQARGVGWPARHRGLYVILRATGAAMTVIHLFRKKADLHWVPVGLPAASWAEILSLNPCVWRCRPRERGVSVPEMRYLVLWYRVLRKVLGAS